MTRRQDDRGEQTGNRPGEEDLLAGIFPHLPVGRWTDLGPGDDAALLRAPDGRVLVSTDVLVAGRHFRPATASPQDVGWRAAAQNLADVAAMGGVPTALVVALVMPGDPPGPWGAGWPVELSRGLAAACRGIDGAEGAGVVGGDLSAGDDVVVSVTVLGDLRGHPPVLRDGARPGDVVALAGVQGRSAAGLALLERAWPAAPGERAGDTGTDGTPGLADLVSAHRRPRPPCAAGPAAAAAGATAMLDVSDGLLRDAGRLARASRVDVDLSRVLLEPFRAALVGAAEHLGADPWTFVLAGGEDHGLLATFPPQAALPPAFVPVGRVRDRGTGDPVVQVDGEAWTGAVGWDHLGG